MAILPADIRQPFPTLTYDYFLNFHRKYYHPSNSYIFLYGDADLDEELSFINEKYLSNFEKSTDIASIKLQKPFEKNERCHRLLSCS